MSAKTHKTAAPARAKTKAKTPAADADDDVGLASEALAAHAARVEVGGMADKTKKAGGLLAGMQQAAVASFTQHAPDLDVHAIHGAPSRSAGFLVDASVSDLKVTDSRVSCSVTMYIATLPDKSMFAMLNGHATVDAGSTSEHALAAARADGVNSVVEDLVTSKVIPAIHQRTADADT
jgi:hypothetical protein